jgi:hypothetical protein
MRTPRHPQDFPICRPVISEDLCPLWKYPAFWGGSITPQGGEESRDIITGSLGSLAQEDVHAQPGQQGVHPSWKENQHWAPYISEKNVRSSVPSQNGIHHQYHPICLRTLKVLVYILYTLHIPLLLSLKKTTGSRVPLFGVFLKGTHFFKGVKHVYKPERSPFWMRCKQEKNARFGWTQH